MTDPFSTIVISWDKKEAAAFATEVKQRCDLSHDPIVISRFDHETAVLNEAIQVGGENTEFVWLLTPDVLIRYPEVPYLMAEFMVENEQVGVMCPNREGEPMNLGALPELKYLQDNTAIMYRKTVGARFDEEFIFTGWSDLDFGLEVERRGYYVFIETRASVVKMPTSYGSWSAFRSAYNARNRILLEAKWFWGRVDDWQGVDAYNARVNENRRIPTMFELAWWTEDRLLAFSGSVNHEHPQICMTDGHTGNEGWEFTG